MCINNQIYSAKMNDLINFLKKNPRLIEYQKKIIRNESLLTDLKLDGIQ